MKINLKNEEYIFLTAYQKQNQHRNAFNTLAKEVFGITFEDWFTAKYWNEKYIPYTLFLKDKAVANVSVNIMHFNVFDEKYKFIQIGTVMTDKCYRNKGLSRFLIETVLREWRNKCDLIYLYSNPSALHMYSKFGFMPVKEYSCFKPLKNNSEHVRVAPLNMSLQSNRDKLYNLAKECGTFGRISMKENADLVMFYCTSFLKDNIYYIQSLDVLVVATHDKNQLLIWDIFGEREVDLDHIISFLKSPQTNEVMLGFTPNDIGVFSTQETKGNDTLFVLEDKIQLFSKNKIMFPLLSHA